MNYIIAIIITILFTYWNLPDTFFQQDEWQANASNIYHLSSGLSGIIESFLPAAALSHFTPLARVFSWFEYIFYYTNYTPYAWQSVGLHIFNVLLLYYLTFSWFKKRNIAFIAALFFGINSIPHQAVTWVTNTNSYEIPTTFILLSLLFFQRFVAQKEHRRINIFLSLVMLFISLLFHENGIFLLLFYPVVLFLQRSSERKKLLTILGFSIALFIFAYFLIRVPFFFGFLNPLPAVTDISRPPLVVYPYRMVSIALKSFAGSFFPEKVLIQISDEVVRLAYPQFITSDNVPNPYISQSIVFDLVSYVITGFVVAMVLLFMRIFSDILNKERLTNVFIWTVIFVPTSLLPYAFVLGRAGYASIIEPRFFYVGSIGISILVAIIAYSVVKKFSEQKTLKIIVYLLLGLYLLSHIYAIRESINNLVKIGTQRKMFLTTINSSYPNLTQKVVFFTESDTAYYGMPDNEKILPLQIGFGKMLMIWYQKEEQFPGCLYEGQFLLDLLEEGYRFCEGRGFGYFRRYDKLVEAIEENDIKPDEVIAYDWNGSINTFKDIAPSIQSKLRNDLRIRNETFRTK